MPYPSPTTYPSGLLYPGTTTAPGTLIGVGAFVLGAVDENGCAWSVMDFEGWTGSPDTTLQLTQRARGAGAVANEPFLRERNMVISGMVSAPDADSLNASLDAFNAAVTLDPFQLAVSESGRLRSVMAQRNGAVLTPKINSRFARYSIQVVAKDPIKYGDLVTASTLLPKSSGGLVRPSTWPRTWSGVSASGQVVVTNPGNAPAPVWLRIDGPVPAGGWTVTHVGKKQSLAFATSLALVAGEFITVDMEAREVLAQGQAPRAGYVTSRGWFTLDPGDNTIAFSAANYSPTAQLTVTTKPSWS